MSTSPIDRLVPLAVASLLCLCPINPTHAQEKLKENSFSDQDLGVELTLPDASWKKTDQSQGNAKVFIFSASPKMVPRCTVISLPRVFLPEGIVTREQQLKLVGKGAYQRVSLENVKFADHDARRFEYRMGPSKTIEWEIKTDQTYLIFQLAASERSWKEPKTKMMLDAIADSFVFSGGKEMETAEQPKVATIEEIRAARKPAATIARPFQLRRHELNVDIEPKEQSLRVRDRITLRALVDDVKQLKLYTSVVTVHDVKGPEGMAWRSIPRDGAPQADGTVKELQLTFAESLPKDKDVTIEVTAGSEDFFHAIDQQLVAEVAVLGQVRARSSYSSHILYYPVDERKEGAVDLTLSVPEGMTAVTGGELISSTTENGRSLYRYKTDDVRARLLPFGFAAAKYIERSGESDGGLRLTFYGYPGEEKLLDQRIEAAVESANVFEKLMGSLPWKDVRFAHVTCERKETGVSLPGLILISDGFFTDFSSIDISDGNLQNPDILSLLIVADELSHQWNAYAVPLPNQLAEGISTFTNVLFMEQRAGRKTFDNAIRFCRNSYFMTTSLGPDVAIADPAIYQTAAYRGIAFTKTPVALAMLRDKVGDDAFFAGWREAFQSFGEDRDGFEVIETAFSKTTGQDLKPFFDQWFYRPGWPKLKITHQQTGKKVKVTCEQTQAGGPFELPVKLVAKGSDGETYSFRAELDKVKTSVEIECPFEVQAIVIDPDEIGLVQLDG